MRIVATMSLPAVDRPNEDRWNATRSCQKTRKVNDIPIELGPAVPDNKLELTWARFSSSLDWALLQLICIILIIKKCHQLTTSRQNYQLLSTTPNSSISHPNPLPAALENPLAICLILVHNPINYSYLPVT